MEFVYVNSVADRDRLIEAGLEQVGHQEGTSLWAFKIAGMSYAVLDEILEQLDIYVF